MGGGSVAANRQDTARGVLDAIRQCNNDNCGPTGSVGQCCAVTRWEHPGVREAPGLVAKVAVASDPLPSTSSDSNVYSLKRSQARLLAGGKTDFADTRTLRRGGRWGQLLRTVFVKQLWAEVGPAGRSTPEIADYLAGSAYTTSPFRSGKIAYLGHPAEHRQGRTRPILRPGCFMECSSLNGVKHLAEVSLGGDKSLARSCAQSVVRRGHNWLTRVRGSARGAVAPTVAVSAVLRGAL